MEKLIQKFKSYVNGYVGSSMLTNTEYPETILENAKKCANICNEHTISFLDWLEKSDYKYDLNTKMYKHKLGILKTNEELVKVYNNSL